MTPPRTGSFNSKHDLSEGDESVVVEKESDGGGLERAERLRHGVEQESRQRQPTREEHGERDGRIDVTPGDLAGDENGHDHAQAKAQVDREQRSGRHGPGSLVERVLGHARDADETQQECAHELGNELAQKRVAQAEQLLQRSLDVHAAAAARLAATIAAYLGLDALVEK